MFFRAFGRYVFGNLGKEANIIIWYYLVPCRLSTDPKIRDLGWLWIAWRAILRYMFTITNCHWLIICYLFTVVCLLHVRERIYLPSQTMRQIIVNNTTYSGRLPEKHKPVNAGRLWQSKSIVINILKCRNATQFTECMCKHNNITRCK